MLLHEAENKILKLRDVLKAKWSGWLPFKGYYIDQLATLLSKNLEWFRAVLTDAQKTGNARGFVNFVIDFAKGHIAGLFAGMALEMMRAVLLANADSFLDKMGTARPE